VRLRHLQALGQTVPVHLFANSVRQGLIGVNHSAVSGALDTIRETGTPGILLSAQPEAPGRLPGSPRCPLTLVADQRVHEAESRDDLVGGSSGSKTEVANVNAQPKRSRSASSSPSTEMPVSSGTASWGAGGASAPSPRRRKGVAEVADVEWGGLCAPGRAEPGPRLLARSSARSSRALVASFSAGVARTASAMSKKSPRSRYRQVTIVRRCPLQGGRGFFHFGTSCDMPLCAPASPAVAAVANGGSAPATRKDCGATPEHRRGEGEGDDDHSRR